MSPSDSSEMSRTHGEPLLDDRVGDHLAAGLLERDVAVAAAEDRHGQPGALAVGRAPEPVPGADRIDDDERQPGLEHLLGHDGRGVRLAGAAHREDPEGLGDRVERERQVVAEAQLHRRASIAKRSKTAVTISSKALTAVMRSGSVVTTWSAIRYMSSGSIRSGI